MSQFIAGWYVIYTRPNSEKRVEGRLKNKAVQTFLPVRKELRNWSDRKKCLEVPLFPSYLFAFLQNFKDYNAAIDVDGLVYFLKTNKKLARINDSIIKNIRLLVELGQQLEVTAFRTGQQLIICDGMLNGQPCEFIEWNGGKKALVQIGLLQRTVIATLPEDYLEAASAN